METVKVASYLNTVKRPNAMGQAVTIADDLRNVDEGIDISDLTVDQLKAYVEDLITAVETDIMRGKKYQEETFGLYHDSAEFGGALQVVKNRARLTTYDSHILDLEDANTDPNATDYTDGKYYGPAVDNRIFTKDSSFKIKLSKSVEMLKKTFATAADVEAFFALVEQNAINTVSSNLKELARSIIVSIVKNCSQDRIIPLATLYNTTFGYTSDNPEYIADGTAAIKNNHKFAIFCLKAMNRIANQMLDYNKKYNDGTVEVFANKEDIRLVMLEEFYTDMKFTQSGIINEELTDFGEVSTLNFWQNASTSLLPVMNANSVHDQIKIDNGVGEDPTVINHVIGIAMDRYTAGITNRIQKTTSKNVEEEDFVTFFTHVVKRYWIDTRDMAVVFTLN